MIRPSAVFRSLLALAGSVPGAVWSAESWNLDLNFNANFNASAYVTTLSLQTNGQLYVGGVFSLGGNSPRVNVARLNSDGSLDNAFNPGTAVDLGLVTSILAQPGGKVIVAGSFYSSTGIAPNNIVRLNSNGSVDSTFKQTLNVDGPINAIALQSDGRILIAGNFIVVDGLVRRSVARLMQDGSVDSTFDACVATSPDGGTAMHLLSDGRILIGGTFNFSTGVSRTGIARLRSTGDVESNFAPEPGVEFGATVYSIAVRDNGNIIIGGNFYTYHNSLRRGVAQLIGQAPGGFGEGTLDQTFNPGSGITPGSTVFSVALQPDDKVLIGGNFQSYQDVQRYGVARLNTDASLDADFNVQNNEAPYVTSVTVAPAAKLMVSGLYSTFADGNMSGLVRLQMMQPPFSLGKPTKIVGGYQFQFFGQANTSYAVEHSSNLVDWLAITNFTCDSSPVWLFDPSTNSQPRQFYRGLLQVP